MHYDEAIFDDKVRQYIEKNLKIFIEQSKNSYGDDVVRVKLLLENQVIDSDYIAL